MVIYYFNRGNLLLIVVYNKKQQKIYIYIYMCVLWQTHLKPQHSKIPP